MASSARKILITAFEPFGLVRGHVPGLRGNRSLDLLRALESHHRRDDLEFMVLPVSGEASHELSTALARGPAGAILLGEDLAAAFRIETTAFDPNHQIGLFPIPGAKARVSGFAQAVGRTWPDISSSSRSTIGTYFCNRLYWQAQSWGEHAGRPTVFVHVGLLESEQTQYGRLLRLLRAMREKVN